VLLIRLPFLNQAVQGDDPYYLAAAFHALIDPLHPNHTWYVFGGIPVNFQGYPHPPGNAWFLTGLLTIFGDVREIPFHAFYMLFSVAAVFAAYALARRFSGKPFWATLLFAVVPVFVVNGNSFESDTPLLAFWTAGAALFVYGVDRSRSLLLVLSAICLAAAGMISMQSILFTPILLMYLVFERRLKSLAGLLVATAPIFALAAWQVFERVTSGLFPAEVAAGYQTSYGYVRLAAKILNAESLTVHLLFLVFPILLPFAVLAMWRNRNDRDIQFLVSWIAIFLCGAYVLFYAGSARYLLPLAPPLAILTSAAPFSSG
jgi:4-amino-4-deoxy-L-arabinose transferase-like glycosyltransferase